MPWTTYLENKVLDHFHGGTAFTAPTGLVIALWSVMPTKAYTSGAPDGTEISGSGYARQTIAFSAAASGSVQNSAQISFPVATSNYSATVVGWGVLDGSGNMLEWHKFETTYTAEVNILPTTGEGINTVTLDNGASGVSTVIVKDSTDTTTYTEGTDYFVDYDAGKVIRITTGTIGSGATLHITYNAPTTRTVNKDDQLTIPAGFLKSQLKGYV
jgi:hypothetical protein